MTPEEVLRFYERQAADASSFARLQADAGDPFCLFNWSSAAGSQFYRALISWRTRLLDPEPILQSALTAAEAATGFIANHSVGRERYHFDAVPGICAALLLDRPGVEIIAEARFVLDDPDQRGITPDRKVMAWLVSAMSGGDAGDGPALAAKLAAAKRTALWGETLRAYFELLNVPTPRAEDAWALTHVLVDLYDKRRRNAYLRGGSDYLGGEEPELIIDGLLATIWHVRRWDSSGLSETARLHTVPPSAHAGGSLRSPRDEGLA